jgi:hypothetical protein
MGTRSGGGKKAIEGWQLSKRANKRHSAMGGELPTESWDTSFSPQAGYCPILFAVLGNQPWLWRG